MGEAAVVTELEPAPPVVLAAGLDKRYGAVQALRSASVQVGSGEIYGLIGPDGSGKSSLMKIVAGVLTPDAGGAEVFGVPLVTEADTEKVKGRIGFMPQGLGLNLYPELSVEENIDYFADLRLTPPEQASRRKEQLLAVTRLGPFRHRPMKQLSGGMKQKLGLVCTLIHGPELVILDEPTTGVDPVSRRDFWKILGNLLSEEGITALVSTAYLDEASRFHRLALMHSGSVLAEGTPEEVRSLVPGTLVSVAAEPQMEALHRLEAVFAGSEAMGSRIRVFAERLEPAAAEVRVRTLLEGLRVRDLSTHEPELEDVFVAALRKGEAHRRLPLISEQPATALAAVGGHADIVADELTREFDGFRAVDRVSFRVSRGEIFGLLGANGAGKTTVIKMLTGILPPTSGKGHVAGIDMRRPGLEVKREIGYVSQAFSLYLDLTVAENLDLYAGIYGLGRAESRRRVAWALELGGLQEYRGVLAASLPMGLRQRLALGCALIHQPSVLFLDEPTSGVDPIGRRDFWDLLIHLSRGEGVAILITTHYLSEAEHCDRIGLMYAGRLVVDAAPELLKQQVETEVGQLLEVATDYPDRAVRALEATGYAGAALFGRSIHVFSRDPAGDAARIPGIFRSAGIATGPIRLRPLSLEDVFVYRVTSLEAARNVEGGPS